MLAHQQWIKTLEEVISVKTELGKLLVEYISSSNLQVVYREIKSLANNFADHKSVIIQSSHNLSVDLKQNVREYFHKMDKFCFPIFSKLIFLTNLFCAVFYL